MTRPIHHTFGPLADGRQCRLALSALFRPWRWQVDEKHTEALRAELSSALRGDAFLFDAGRTGLLALLCAAGIGPGDDVIVQGYTCVVVPNAIQAAGARTVYADIDADTLNLTIESVAESITPKTKAVICQHTFGLPADLAGLRALCDANKLLLIEDCAHVLPDEAGPPLLAQTGDAVLLSFGRDKAVSGVSGGAVVSRSPQISEHLKTIEREAPGVPDGTIARLLLYPIIYAKARLLYRLGLGRYYLYACKVLHLLVPIVSMDEKNGKQSQPVRRIAGACARLALDQWRNRRWINDHRRRLTALYLAHARNKGWVSSDAPPACPSIITSDLPLQKFPLFVRDAKRVRTQLEAQNIFLDDGWTGCVVCPASVKMDQLTYESGSDPEAEAACQAILSLPTHPGTSDEDARRVLTALDPLLS